MSLYNPVLQAQFDYTMVHRNINPYSALTERESHRNYNNEYERLRREDAAKDDLQEVTA